MIPRSYKTITLLTMMVIIAVTPTVIHGTVTLNEVMSSNLTSVMDEFDRDDVHCLGSWCNYIDELEPFGIAQYDGKYPDWIELYNSGDTAASLQGYGITDDPTSPFKWVFPNYNIPAGGHFLLYATGKDLTPVIADAQTDGWETVINQGDEWRYFVGTEAPPSNWDTLDFDDTSWASGASGFGWGDDDDATVIPSNTVSVYIRKEFYIDDISAVDDCVMHLDFDDGFLASANGIDIAEMNVRVMDFTPVRNTTTALLDHEAKMYSGGIPETFAIDNFKSVLRTGRNVLAISIHAKWSSDEDLTAIPFLSLKLSQAPQEARGIPSILQPLLVTGEAGGTFYPHTNFKLGGGGETIVLTAPDGTMVDMVETGRIPVDFSYGRITDAGESWSVFHEPTPEMNNNTDPFPGFIDVVDVSMPGGTYDGDITVSLSASAGAEIRYTTDCSEPTAASTLYSGSLTISDTTVLRAQAYQNGILSSLIETRTYIIGNNTTMAVISISTDNENLYGGTLGIYTKGTVPGHDNYRRDSERVCNVEFFDSDGTLGFNQITGFKLSGRSTRTQPRKSLALMARGRYGNDRFSYPVFTDQDIDEYKSLVLRNAGNDIQGSLIRDSLTHDIVKHLDIDTIRSRPVVIYLNGNYWGIYNLREKQNESYLASHHNVDPDDLNIVELYRGEEFKGAPSSPVVIEGGPENYRALTNYFYDNDISIPENYEYVKTLIDINSYLDHHIAQAYYVNIDWMGNNYKAWRPNAAGGKWRYLFFDLDFAFEGRNNYFGDGNNDADYNMIDFLTNPDGPKSSYPEYSNLISRGLLDNEEFRTAFINRSADFLNTIFLPEMVAQRVDEFQAMYEPEIPNHMVKWNFLYRSMRLNSLSYWHGHLDQIRTFADIRPGYMRQHIVDEWDLGGTSEVTLDVSDTAGGVVTISTVKPDAYPWSGTYFQDVPVEITAIPNPGYAFAGWEGLEQVAKPAAWDAILTTTLPDSLSLTAVFEPSSDSMNSVVITEINHDSAADFGTGDWIELYNGYETPLDVSGWRIRDDDDIQSYVLPLHTTIDPGGYLVVAREVLAFTELFPGVTTVVGGFAFGFDGNDAARLYDAAGDLVDIVNYDTGLYWPSGADGTGSTLGLRGTDLDNGTPDNWGVTLPNGTPGAPNTFTEGSLIVINEINYNPSVEVPSEDWVELYNTGDEAIDLSGWVLRDDNDDHTFTLPSGTMIDADGYLVLCRDAAAFAAVFPAVGSTVGSFIFGLSNNGDTVRLFDSGGVLVDVVVYDDEYPWPEASDGDGSTLSLKNPESDNGYFAHWVASTGSGTPGEQNDIYSVGVEDDAGMLPTVFALGQNYPNPFNGVTTIPFSLPGDEHVTATVHSLTGQRVATLIDARLEPGNHVVMFRPEGLASGIYLVHITAGNFRAGRRMVYIK
jgi:hypothetical protein